MSPIVLEGRHVRLVPLTLDHAEGLLDAAREPEVWTYLTVPQPTTRSDMEAYISSALEEQVKGTQVPFTVLANGQVVGTTRYLDIRPADAVLEIGWTWYAKEVWRTSVNTECKFLLLRHAFETLGAGRVQLKTDALNERSRSAIERIGGQFEGVLRQYQIYWHGRVRDTAMYSILVHEWPRVKTALESKLEYK